MAKTFIKILGVRSDPNLRGVIPNSFDHIFTHISRSQDQQYLVRASYLEIYQVFLNLNSFIGLKIRVSLFLHYFKIFVNLSI